MARKKLEIQATETQLETLYDSFKAGVPLPLALQRSNITTATYYYWVAIASIVIAVKSQEELEELEELAKSGVSIQQVRDLAEAAIKDKKSAIGTFIEPSAESLLRYRNSRKFRDFADQCYDIISRCNKTRSDFATMQLTRIALSTQKKNGINPSGAMWWLERNLPDYFAKPSDKAKEQETDIQVTTQPLKVEFIDPSTTDNMNRLQEMEQKILNELKGNGEA